MIKKVKNEAGYIVKEINESVKNNAAELVEAFENKYNEKINTIADNAIKNNKRIIMLSGPSASGKTTTSLKLAKAFESRGIKSAVVSLDNFYRNIEDAPRLPNGERDFESIRALDTDLITEKLNHIEDTRYTKMPVFDFVKGKRIEDAVTFDIGKDGIAIVEGIHALNDVILNNIRKELYITVYISIHSNFCENDKVILPKRSLRLVQRIVRDYHKRGSSPENTLKMWEKVCEGEDLYIRPHSKNAQVHFDTTLPYSPGVLKNEAISLFKSIDKESVFFKKANSIIEALSQFDDVDADFIPKDSVLREFCGGSIFEQE